MTAVEIVRHVIVHEIHHIGQLSVRAGKSAGSLCLRI
ncbi:DinB family protein [Alicyclobacillus fastidiosus]|uniref:DinB family protein n=1 Tax=Alicyclobacillus fastidiosus TaxID=392011 RepID=A0ABV5AAK7_9BACL